MTMIEEAHTCDIYDEDCGQCPNPATRLAWEYRSGKPDRRVYFCEEHSRPDWVQDCTDPLDMEPDDIEPHLFYGLHEDQRDRLGP